jgi:short-subunit dehydrogenase
VSILVNNAGISPATPVLQAPLSDIRDELETNRASRSEFMLRRAARIERCTQRATGALGPC